MSFKRTPWKVYQRHIMFMKIFLAGYNFDGKYWHNILKAPDRERVRFCYNIMKIERPQYINRDEKRALSEIREALRQIMLFAEAGAFEGFDVEVEEHSAPLGDVAMVNED